MAWAAIGQTSPIGGAPSPPAFLSKGDSSVINVIDRKSRSGQSCG